MVQAPPLSPTSHRTLHHEAADDEDAQPIRPPSRTNTETPLIGPTPTKALQEARPSPKNSKLKSIKSKKASDTAENKTEKSRRHLNASNEDRKADKGATSKNTRNSNKTTENDDCYPVNKGKAKKHPTKSTKSSASRRALVSPTADKQMKQKDLLEEKSGRRRP